VCVSYDGRLVSTIVKYYNETYKLADEYLIKDISGFGKILIFGFLYTNPISDNHSIVTPIVEVVKKEFFTNLMKDTDIRLVCLYFS
jgi:hypothetical protein